MAATRPLAWVLFASVILSGCSQPTNPASSSTSTTQTTETAHIGDTVGYFTIQKIDADSVDGLYRYPYPVAREQGEPKTIHIGDEVGAACEGMTHVLTAIDAAGQAVTFQEKHYDTSPGGCPICLSGDTSIDTPAGPVNVKDLRIGMQVWSLKAGERVAAPVEKVSRTPSPHHFVVHLVLEDGRALDASPGHPLTDGRLLGALAVGDVVDGSTVHSAELVPYDQPFTYDILVGEGYWANGILVGSTLVWGATA